MIYQSLVFAYAKAIYADGTKHFPEIRQEYVPHVMQYAANNYSQSQLEDSLSNKWITVEAYQDTLSYRV